MGVTSESVDTGATREWHEIFKVTKIMDLQLRLLNPSKLLFKTEGGIAFQTIKKVKEFVIIKPVVQKILKVLL